MAWRTQLSQSSLLTNILGLTTFETPPLYLTFILWPLLSLSRVIFSPLRVATLFLPSFTSPAGNLPTITCLVESLEYLHGGEVKDSYCGVFHLLKILLHEHRSNPNQAFLCRNGAKFAFCSTSYHEKARSYLVYGIKTSFLRRVTIT